MHKLLTIRCTIMWKREEEQNRKRIGTNRFVSHK